MPISPFPFPAVFQACEVLTVDPGTPTVSTAYRPLSNHALTLSRDLTPSEERKASAAAATPGAAAKAGTAAAAIGK